MRLEKTVHVDSIVPFDMNFKPMTAKQYKALKKSLRKHGFRAPILAHERGEGVYRIIDGHHRWKAAKEIGIHEIPVIVSESDEDDAIVAELMATLNLLHGDPDRALLLDMYERYLSGIDMAEFLESVSLPKTYFDGMSASETVDIPEEQALDEAAFTTSLVAYNVFTDDKAVLEMLEVQLRDMYREQKHIIKQLCQIATDKDIDQDELFYLLCCLAFRRLLTSKGKKWLPNQVNPNIPFILRLRGRRTDLEKVLERYEEVMRRGATELDEKEKKAAAG